MTDKQIMKDGVDVSNFCLVCYYDNKTNELVRIEQYNDNDSSMYSDIESYKYGYNAKIVKPEEIIKQLSRKEQECKELKEQLKEMNEVIRTETTRCSLVNNLKTELDQLKADNESLRKQLQFEFDETLLQYSNTIEDLQKQLNNTVVQKCPQCGEVYLNPVGAKLYETLTEIKEIAEEKANVNDWLALEILQKISEVEDEN